MLYRSIGFAWPTNRDIPQALRDLYLREAGEVEWRDNRLLAYINGRKSFQGVPRHHLGGRARRLLLFGSLLARSTAARVYEPGIRYRWRGRGVETPSHSPTDRKSAGEGRRV